MNSRGWTKEMVLEGVWKRLGIFQSDQSKTAIRNKTKNNTRLLSSKTPWYSVKSHQILPK